MAAFNIHYLFSLRMQLSSQQYYNELHHNNPQYVLINNLENDVEAGFLSPRLVFLNLRDTIFGPQ